ncbi:hypothetical protein OIU84_027176 [Salix udensis]|uniref:adenylate kinase n=1 Tax=Salix udensis TaxID=889485 RepID=A0AAD6KGA3_9ROSI|nr:hypothetical protein OIU84_027176 [Salix udensis]
MEKGPLNSLVLPQSPLSSSSLLTYLSLTVTSDIASLFVPHQTLLSTRFNETKNSTFVVASAKANPLKIMISGAPASGKGTQFFHMALMSMSYLTSANAWINMQEEVGMMVMKGLLLPDSQEYGWLLDGCPRSLSQATALKEFGLQPDLFILLEVNEEILVERVVGRRLDPATGKIYHLNYSPPETEEIAARLTQCVDDTEDKVKLWLQAHHRNVEAVLSMLMEIFPKDDVFAQIDGALTKLLEDRKSSCNSLPWKLIYTCY